MSVLDKVKVLIVEDDPMVKQVISGFLGKHQAFIQVGETSTYVTAQNFIKMNQVDLVLLDVYLPDGLGIDLLQWMTQMNYAVNTILITADNRAETLEKALRYGAIDYLVKPFRMERFDEALNNYIKKRNLLKDKKVVEQVDIDHMFRHDPMTTEQKNQPGDYKNQTYELIMNYLKKEAPKSHSASEVAQGVGISRITARKYLDSMELSGEIVLELSYGNVGRPKNHYRYGSK